MEGAKKKKVPDGNRIRVRDTQPHCNVQKRKEKRNLKEKKKTSSKKGSFCFYEFMFWKGCKVVVALMGRDVVLPTGFMSLLALRKTR